MTSALKLRAMARKSLENATFYHGVALPRQSCAVCCQNPTFFCTAHDPCAIFSREATIWRASGLSRIFHGRAGIPGPQKPIQNQSLRGETMTRRIVTGALVGALAVAFSAGAAAQANPQNSAYVSRCADSAAIAMSVRNGTAERLCWRTGYWTPAQAIIECDPDLVPKPPPPRPAAGCRAAAASAAAAAARRPRRRRCRRSRSRRRHCSTSTRRC